MHLFFTLLQKELKHYFNSPIAAILLIAFFVLGGWFFTSPLFINNQATMAQFFYTLPMLLIFFAPALSMRLFSEEKRQGTLESLVTLPIKDSTIVLGKFFGALVFMGVALLGSVLYTIILMILGKPELGVILASYLGILLLVGAMLSYGMFISSLTKNQIIAFIISIIVSLILILSDQLTFFLPAIGDLSNMIGFSSHFQSFVKGVVDLRDVVFFLSIIIFMCLLTKESLDHRNT